MINRRFLILAWRTWQEFCHDNCSQMAAALSYYILFAIVPLTMFGVAVLGTIFGDDLQQRFANYISENFEFSSLDVTLELTSDGRDAIADEYGEEAVVAIEAELARFNSEDASRGDAAELAEELANGGTVTIAGYEVPPNALEVNYNNIVLETIAGVIDSSAPLTVVSFIVLGYAATGLFGAVRRSLNFVWGFPTPPPLIKGKFWDVVLLLMLLTIAVLTLVALLTVSVLASILLRVFDPTQTGGGAAQLLWNVVQFLVPLVLTFLMFLTLYRFGPRRHNRFRDVWPGALLAALGFEVLKFGYAIYASNFATFDVVYGALGGVLLFMFFTYLAAYIFLMGAELAAEFPGVMAGRHDDEPIPPLETLQSIRARVRTMLSRKS